MNHQKICVAQIKSIKGNIELNIQAHIQIIHRASEAGADLIIFPELSLTGYHPSICDKLTISHDDASLDVFDKISDQSKMTIIVGAPLKIQEGVAISSFIFSPNSARNIYTKQYLHEDELPYFKVTGHDDNLIGESPRIAISICYELTVPAHHHRATQNNANIYLSSVAKSKSDMIRSHKILADISCNTGMSTLVTNSVGMCEEYMCGGYSAVWNKKGEILDHLNEVDEGILIYDYSNDRIHYKWQSNNDNSLSL